MNAVRLGAAAAVLLLAAPAVAADAPAAPAPRADPEVAAAVKKMQAFYERTKGFDTRFEQRFVAGAGSRLGGVAGGRLRFRKPEGGTGPLMRWDYDDGRILLLVKDTSWTYDPDTKQATEYRVDPAQLSAAVTFLWGEGRLDREFEITRAGRTDLAEGLALALDPKQPTGAFTRVFLVVDPATGVVRESVVVQPNGAENRIRFLAPKTDVKLDGAAFDPARAFPEGTTRIKAAVPGMR
jgi:outer membrane lipoprotein carrier protein